MATEETNIKQRIRLLIGKEFPNVRLFSNPCGTGWVGKLRSYKDGVAIIENARRVNFGLQPGSGDEIGWTSTIVTPEMVGKKLAIFTSLEVKTEIGRPTKEQSNFAGVVQFFGGIAGIVRSPSEAAKLLSHVPD